MEKKTGIEAVKEFHEYSGHPVGDKPQLLADERAMQRLEYMDEELKEFYAATEKDGGLEDLNEAVDALADLQYFLYGTLVEMGIPKECWKEFFAEVHRANMTKFCKTEAQAIESVEQYVAGTHPQAIGKPNLYASYREENGLFIVFDTKTSKVLKSINTEKPNTQPILDKYLK